MAAETTRSRFGLWEGLGLGLGLRLRQELGLVIEEDFKTSCLVLSCLVLSSLVLGEADL
jgi:hypothetical protein